MYEIVCLTVHGYCLNSRIYYPFDARLIIFCPSFLNYNNKRILFYQVRESVMLYYYWIRNEDHTKEAHSVGCTIILLDVLRKIFPLTLTRAFNLSWRIVYGSFYFLPLRLLICFFKQNKISYYDYLLYIYCAWIVGRVNAINAVNRSRDLLLTGKLVSWLTGRLW